MTQKISILKKGVLSRKEFKTTVLFFIIGLLTGIIIGFTFALDYGVRIASQILDISLKPEIVKQIVIRYGPNVINGF